MFNLCAKFHASNNKVTIPPNSVTHSLVKCIHDLMQQKWQVSPVRGSAGCKVCSDYTAQRTLCHSLLRTVDSNTAYTSWTKIPATSAVFYSHNGSVSRTQAIHHTTPITCGCKYPQQHLGIAKKMEAILLLCWFCFTRWFCGTIRLVAETLRYYPVKICCADSVLHAGSLGLWLRYYPVKIKFLLLCWFCCEQ